jgi:hypothetical protein
MIAPPPRIGKFAASTKNPRPKDSERQPRNAEFHVASENPVARPRRKPRKQLPAPKAMQPMGLINR